MKKKNGFTLIELLAVIVILAVIALIVTPMVMNTINSAREGAAKSSGYELFHAIETKLAVIEMSGADYKLSTTAIAASGTVPARDAAVLNVAAGVVTPQQSLNDTNVTVDWASLANHTNNISGTVYVSGASVLVLH